MKLHAEHIIPVTSDKAELYHKKPLNAEPYIIEAATENDEWQHNEQTEIENP